MTALITVAVGLHAGCAALTQKHVSAGSSLGPSASCEISNRWIVDAVGAGVMAAVATIGAVAVTGRTGTLSDGTIVGGSIAGMGGGLGTLLFVASAYEGVHWNDECEQAKPVSARAAASP